MSAAITVAVAVAPSVARGSSPALDPSIPAPRAFLTTPRVFEARSRDWEEPESGVAGARSSRPTPSTTPMALADALADARSRPSTPGEDEPGDGPRVIGALVGMALYSLRESFGIAGLERVLSSVPTESAYRLRGALMTVAWVPASLLVDLASAAESTFGEGSGAIAVDLGKGVAARILGTSHKHLVQGLSPSAAIQKLPKIWRIFHDGGDVVVGRTPSGAYNVQVGGHAPQALVHAQLMMGFYLGLLEIAGARDVRAEILACMELGTARTVTELRFR